MKGFSGGFGRKIPGLTPKTQSGHGKAHPGQSVVPPHKKGPPMATHMPQEPSVQPSLSMKFPKGLP